MKVLNRPPSVSQETKISMISDLGYNIVWNSQYLKNNPREAPIHDPANDDEYWTACIFTSSGKGGQKIHEGKEEKS